MKIEFNNVNVEKAVTKIKEFEITNDLTLRIVEISEKLIVKLRNTKFTELGRILKINDVESVNQINFAGETYNNLKYLQHEIYIHQPSDGDLVLNTSEDLNITFKKGVANEQIQQ